MIERVKGTRADRSVSRVHASEVAGLLDRLREPLLIADAEFSIVYVNPAAEQALGSTRAALLGSQLATVVPEWRIDRSEPGPGWRVERLAGWYAAFGDVSSDARWMQRMLQAEQLAAVGQLAASVAHEVGAPLTAITVAVEQLLKRECGACLHGSHDLQLVLSQSRRIAELSRRLVDLARPGDPVRRPIDFNAHIAEAFELVEKQLRRDDIDAVLDLDTHVPVVRADPHQLQQVLLNLLLNAAHALRDEGGRVDVSTRATGHWVELVVADTGPGITDEDLPRIFLPFFSRSGGTGLGLPLARQIVHAHGGTIEVSSPPGAGARFTVRIPVAAHE
ncbi:MAG TPA: ATP-binding protein [Longimicrobiales bacterium]|nr:ATP-binding protein [Longimicrobiales bacterium]